jgi:hypothetical protein
MHHSLHVYSASYRGVFVNENSTSPFLISIYMHTVHHSDASSSMKGIVYICNSIDMHTLHGAEAPSSM